MTRYCALFIFTVGLLAAQPSIGLAQKRKQESALWISAGFVSHRTFHDLSWVSPQRTFALTQQNEYHLLSIGYQVRSSLVAYVSLEYNTFSIRTDLNDFAENPNFRQSRSGLPFAPHETVFIQEIQRPGVQRLLFPSIGVERRIRIYNSLNLSLGARISEFMGKPEHYHQSTWGYGGNGIDRFEEIEVNTLTSTGKYRGSKVSIYMVPEWKIAHWTIGATFGLQYKRYSFIMKGETITHKSERTQRSNNFGFSPEEIGLVSGFRITREIPFKRRVR